MTQDEIAIVSQALRLFTECPHWREFLHEIDCCSPSGHEDHPDGRLCKCDGPHNIETVEAALAIIERDSQYNTCEECGQYPADAPSPLCPGCEAYREHQSI